MIHHFYGSISSPRRGSPDGPYGAGPLGGIALLSLCLVISAGAGEPEIVRLRVPAKDVSRWFPAGTELRILPVEQFDSLVRAASKAASRQRAAQPPRLIRARHRARWNAGVLSGRTELVIEAASSGPADFVLDPWTPAVLAAEQSSQVLGARDTGKPSLWIDQAPSQRVDLEWEVRPRPHSRGRILTVAVPGEETTILALEIPKGWMPLVDRGRRRGPLQSTAATASLWEIEPEAGRIDFRLYDSVQGDSPVAPDPWVSGSTQIDLRRSADRGGGLVNWMADWRVELDPRNPRPLEIDLDPGLELIDVQGKSVRGFRIEREAAPTRLAVNLDGELKPSTELRFLAHAQVPSEGAWTIPAIRPRNATWTDGRTTVVLDESHLLEECREKAARRILGPPEKSTAQRQLVFESRSPGSAAELVFRKPGGDSSCSVLGQLFVAGSPIRLECQLNWKLPSASMSELEVELSPAWLPDRVSIRNLEDPINWHSSLLPSGMTRLYVALPVTALAQDELVLVIGAAATVSGGRGPLDLPRVRPVGARLLDEAWLAWVDKSMMIQPTRAVGLAWIDPGEVDGLHAPRGAGSDLHEALAWRWLSDRAQARVDRLRIEQEPSVSVLLRARVDPTAGVLALDGRLLVSAGAGSLDSVPVWIDQPNDQAGSWSFRDEAGGIQFERRPVDEAARARLGFPEHGSACSLLTRVASQTAKTIHFHAERPWNLQGSIPLVAVPRDYLFRGMILVETPVGFASRVKSVGLRRVDPSIVEQFPLEHDLDFAAGTRDDRFSPKRAAVHALAYDDPDVRLELVTEPLTPVRAAGIIREALLTTVVDPKGTTLNRLRLLVRAGEAHSLDLVTRPDISLVRIRRDGSDVVPVQTRSALSIPLLSSGQGPRSSTIVIDYTAERRPASDGERLRPDLPAVSLPCLSFEWEVVTPPGWKAMGCGPGFFANDREELGYWPYAALGVWTPSWSFRPAPRGEDAEGLRILGDRLTTLAADELTFAEWFSRWDSGPWPVIIDRVSLNAAGLGPRSQCVPNRSKAERRNVALATLEQHGLAMMPFPGALLITSLADAAHFEQRDRWDQAIVETLLWGSDRNDRFQTLPRWRGETSPRIASASGDEAADRIKMPHARSNSTFGGAQWPSDDSFIYLIDTRARIVHGWILAASGLLVWFSCRHRLGGARFLVLTAVLSGSLVINWVLPSRYGSYTASAFLGAFVILMVELGERVARLPVTGRTAARSGSSLVRRMAGAAARLALLGVMLGTVAFGQPPPGLGPEPSILALFPYEGSFDPGRPAKEVILRLADFIRLSRWASRDIPAPVKSVRAVSAVHRVSRKSANDIVVDSEMDLVAVGQPPFAWRIPVSSARDIEATLDGQRLPILIEPGGLLGALAISRAGRHHLRIHRSAAARTEAGFETLSLPVNALPSARVVVAPVPEGEQADQPSAPGASRLPADQSWTGRLGSSDRVEVRWPAPGAAVPKRVSGNVEGLILWDIHPAGDRVRGRFTFREAQELPMIRFAHQPGLILRSGSVTAAVDTVWEEDARKHEWTLRAVPPVPAGSTIELDCWMPADAPRGEGGNADASAGVAQGALRHLPRLQPIEVDRYSGSIGVRRPGDWTGRFEPVAEAERINDEAFVKSWGSLPEDPLTLCGTSRFVRESRAALATGPAPTKIVAKPAVQLQLESGRIALFVEAELTEQSGELRQLEAQPPDDVRITEVTADGLADWTTTSNHRLRLIFHRRTPRPRRLLRIRAWIPLVEDPLGIGSRQHRLRVPWLRWSCAEEVGGRLMVSSISKPELQGSTGLTAVSAELATTGGTAPPRHRLTYRVDDARRLGEIVWESIPARVSVSIESQMTMHPDSAEWVAVLRYDVVGGALDVIHLRMPTAWAAGAVLHFTGSKFQLTTETRGPSAYWTITPERPIWGSQRFMLWSSRLLGSEREIAYPEISPLGRGAIDAYLGIVNATGRPPTIENTVGLEKIPFATRFQAREFAAGAGIPVSAYRVTREVWSLRVPLPRNTGHPNGSRDGSARLALADIVVVAAPDRSSLGRAVYETVPEGGSSLWFTLPENCTLLWATVDANPVTPFHSTSGTWSLPLDQRRQSRVALIWKTQPTASASPDQNFPVGLPRAGSGPVPTLVAVYAPPQLMIQGDLGGLEPTAMARLEMARADWLAGSIGDLVSKIDRSSGRDHEKLVSLLISHEMALRSAARNDRRGDPAAAPRRARDAGPSPEKIRTARAARLETIRRAGLEADLASMQRYVGESPVDPNAPLVRVPEATTSDRPRLFGRPLTLIGVMPGIDEPSSRPSLTLENRSWVARVDFAPVRSIVPLMFLVGIGLVTIRNRGGRWINSLAIVMGVALACWLGGLSAAAGSLGLAAVGWIKARG
jgi:hypothetical protein